MSSLLGGAKQPAPTTVAPAPQVDDATARVNSEDTAAKKQGRRTTVLTGDNGLPDLGTTTKTGK